MKTIKFPIPKGYKTLDIKEFSEDDNFYLEVTLIAKKDMCNIKQPHPGFDCPCNK